MRDGAKYKPVFLRAAMGVALLIVAWLIFTTNLKKLGHVLYREIDAISLKFSSPLFRLILLYVGCSLAVYGGWTLLEQAWKHWRRESNRRDS